MRFKYSIVILVFLFSINYCYASFTDSVVKTSRLDTNYIKDMNKYLSVKLNYNSNTEGFFLDNTSGNIDLQPNISHSNNISFNYRFISFGFSLAPSFIYDKALDRKGKTKHFGFGFGLSGKYLTQSFGVSYTHGYYLRNTSDYIPNWNKDTSKYIQFPDLYHIKLFGSTAFKLNPKFSVKALKSMTERQLKSAGSFIFALNYNYYELDDQTKLTGTNSSQKSENLELLVTAGYYYNFVFKQKYYVAMGVTPGYGYVNTHLTTRMPDENIYTTTTEPVVRFDMHFGLGYNTDRFFTGAQLIRSTAAHNNASTTNVIMNNDLFYEIYVGYRFNAPKPVVVVTDFAEKTMYSVLDAINIFK